MALLGDYGRGVERDARAAVVWYCLAAPQGPADAQSSLGVAYGRGLGVTSDMTQAKSWWDSLDGKKVDWIDANSVPPPEVLEARELAALVRCALSKLSGEYQTLLVAKYVDGQPVKKIADDMGCSPVAVTSRLARARKTFRAAFMKLIQSAPDEKVVSL